MKFESRFLDAWISKPERRCYLGVVFVAEREDYDYERFQLRLIVHLGPVTAGLAVFL